LVKTYRITPADPPPEPWIEDLAPALWGIEDRDEYRDREVSRRRRRVDIGPEVTQTSLEDTVAAGGDGSDPSK